MYIQHIATAIMVSCIVSTAAAQGALAPPEFKPTTSSAEPKLIQFVQSTVNRNPLVQAARYRLDAATFNQSAAAKSLYNPELEFEVENSEDETRTIGISQTFDWSRKRSAREAVAATERLAVESDYHLIRRQLTIELLNGLASYQTAFDRTELAKERASLMEQFAEIAKRRFDAGDLQRVDLNFANLVKAEVQIKLATVTSSLADSRQTINKLALFDLLHKWPSLSTDFRPPSQFRDAETVLLDLPEINSARSGLQIVNATVTLRKREQKLDPTIGVIGGEETEGSFVGLRVSVPLPLHNKFKHEVSAALAERQSAQQMLEDALLRAKARLSNSTQRYQIAYAAWEEWQALGQENLLQKTTELRRLWAGGELSTTEFLIQMDRSIDIRDSALELRHELWRSWFEWQAASGQLDQWLGYNIKGDTDAN